MNIRKVIYSHFFSWFHFFNLSVHVGVFVLSIQIRVINIQIKK